MKQLNIIITAIALAIPTVTFAQSDGILRGTVTHAEDGSPVIGANVLLEGTLLGAAAGTDGKYVIDGIPRGEYTISAGAIGFDVQKKKVFVMGDDVLLNFSLTPLVLKGQRVFVSATRAVEGETPVAFSNVDRRTLEERYSSQEIPMLLDEVPNLYSYSLTGSGMGHSEIRLRGFDATRIAVTVNNVPLNDPEDHTTYFYDIPDLSANVQDVQVQRGVGNSLYGTAAIGGSVNILTRGAGLKRGINLTGTWGSFNTRRLNFSYSTGLIDNSYSAYGRFSKVDTDGYRRDSGVKAWSYFLSASRYDRNMTTTFNAFGGPVKAKFAWYGVTKEDLENEDTRRSNYYSPDEWNGYFDEQLDDFLQSHYQIINDWKAAENVRVENTFFHVKGDGFYQTYKTDRDLQEYNIDTEAGCFGTCETDLVRRKNVAKTQWGWLPRVTLTEEDWSLALGAELSNYASEHWGEVRWAQISTVDGPNNRYYAHDIEKFSATFFAHGLYEVSPAVNLMLDFQYQHITHEFDQQPIGAYASKNYEYTLKYDFFSPRAGLNYRWSDELTSFFNFSVARREPKDSDIYDADDPGVKPLFHVKPDSSLDFDEPLVNEETLYDFELGGAWRADDLSFKLNLFYMDFRDEIVPTGQVDDIGLPLYYNAEESVHKGIEISVSKYLESGVYLSGNFSLNDNYFVKYKEIDYDNNGNPIPLDRKDNPIANFPSYLGGVKLGYRGGGASVYFQTRFAGKQYLDNSKNEDFTIDSYSVENVGLSYDFSRFAGLKMQVNVNNVFDTRYETHGYVDWGTAYFIPAAGRSVYFTVTIGL